MKRIKKKIKLPKPVLHEQWIEISRKDGKTITEFFPPNEEFEKLRQEMDPQPDLIYRRLCFSNSVPDEYAWTKPRPESLHGGLFLLRLLVSDWLGVYEQEQAIGNIRALPGIHGSQPRPEAFGPCPCPVCVERANRTAA